MKEVIRYKCDYCIKTLSSKRQMLLHEDKCFKNPKSKSCITCEHFNNICGDVISIENGVEIIKSYDRYCDKYESADIGYKHNYDLKYRLQTNCIRYKERIND